MNFSYEQLRHSWPIATPDGGTLQIPIHSKMTSNNGDLLRHCALAGMGVMARPSFIRALEDAAPFGDLMPAPPAVD